MALIVVTTSPRVAPGLLAPAAWQALSRGRVLTGTPDHPYLPYLDEAGVRVEVVTPDPGALARESRTGTVVWLAAQDGDEDFMRAVGHAAISLDEPPEIEVVPGSYDLPGARLLDLVQVMDRLRRECPWDRKQTHESLVPYLVEEAYEVLETIHEGAYGPPLREELGDLLLQVMFHARLAQERTGPEGTGPEGTAGDGFDIDDVAAGIVEKLVRRHPHVFAEVEVSGADEVGDNWETIKAAERAAKGETASVLGGVPMGQPAISLAAQLLRRAGRAGAPAALAGDLAPTAGARLFALVRETQDAGLDPEAELRAAAREYRRRVQQWEDAADTP
ncbi:MazG family protein [Microbispora bryophytorum]|uniref:Nucleoside triphosphate pyrophosphohydrolase n=1 Tax=Microbispora bryophytorum TaxID=1460882 RepID=A0A8H9H627_9ACTN|nr:MazG family protein [Microbispora bryophytorum]MBD3136576.1 MazG family protein [Microbispora bryophytorum]TQS06172.1 MazG family protein [Microbispora bryophytorum]GGO18178.1 nucleoside triphosphate pyrophosphohydrolase [Microbispora bryophytorum]